MEEIRRDVVRILHRLPDVSVTGEGFAFYQLTDQALDRRDEEERDLLEAEKSADTHFDPLLYKLRQLSAERSRIDDQIRHLVTYARSFVRPRPYQLSILADAAKCSISGIRLISSNSKYKSEIARNIGKSDVTGQFSPPCEDALGDAMSDALAEHRSQIQSESEEISGPKPS
ncbi:hypothetical protein [Nonomuraea dietziae]|uniref:Uncharacterized protein n=1 Tax=Nonomuraea dietziae TaxID=65515 RepID=A0A7W5VHI5_9ACTN|nr:hypothetical protein [Nonomuraea dietziae]MBB3733730.1 hypothetical protein [Nonomuraea dietziae]